MRKTMLAGGSVAATVAIATWLGALFGLELESVALLGVSLGAVVAMVPDGRPEWRLVGFVTGFAAAWIGYVLRAAVLPDSTGGHAVGYALVILICVGAVAAGRGQIALWPPLVGVAALVGAFETAFADAPSQVVETSLVSATAMLLATAFGFLAAASVELETAAPATPTQQNRSNNKPRESYESYESFESIDKIMVESSK